MTKTRTGPERDLLAAFLDQQRDALLWKLDGLDDAQLRQRIRPGGLHLLGLVKHHAATEWYWLADLFDRPAEPWTTAASDELELDPGDTTESVLGFFARARASGDAAIRELDLDATGVTWLGDTVSFRWSVLHVIEEAARHLGHADLIREHIDGATGHLSDADLPY